MHESKIVVPDLCCASEEEMIRKKFGSMEGIQSLHVNLVARRLSITHSTPAESLLRGLREIGLPGSLESSSQQFDRSRHIRHQRRSLLASAGFFVVGIVASLIVAVPSFVPAIIYAGSMISGGWQVARKGWNSIRHGSLDINILMSVAVVGAVAIGQFQEGAAVILLYAASLLLESMSTERTRTAIHSLMHLSPLTATIVRGDQELLVSSDRITVGDIVRVRPGERIPADGLVTAGTSSAACSSIAWKNRRTIRGSHRSFISLRRQNQSGPNIIHLSTRSPASIHLPCLSSHCSCGSFLLCFSANHLEFGFTGGLSSLSFPAHAHW
jgi:Cd2+/Zn2+-exporting ATPase